MRGARRHRTLSTLRVGGLFVSKGSPKIAKMEPCVQSKTRDRSPFSCMTEIEKRRQLEAKWGLKRFAPDSVWEKALELMRKRPESAI